MERVAAQAHWAHPQRMGGPEGGSVGCRLSAHAPTQDRSPLECHLVRSCFQSADGVSRKPIAHPVLCVCDHVVPSTAPFPFVRVRHSAGHSAPAGSVRVLHAIWPTALASEGQGSGEPQNHPRWIALSRVLCSNFRAMQTAHDWALLSFSSIARNALQHNAVSGQEGEAEHPPSLQYPRCSSEHGSPLAAYILSTSPIADSLLGR